MLQQWWNKQIYEVHLSLDMNRRVFQILNSELHNAWNPYQPETKKLKIVSSLCQQSSVRDVLFQEVHMQIPRAYEVDLTRESRRKSHSVVIEQFNPMNFTWIQKYMRLQLSLNFRIGMHCNYQESLTFRRYTFKQCNWLMLLTGFENF